MKTLTEIVTDSYLATALWSSLDHDKVDKYGNSPNFDGNYDVSDFSALGHAEAYIDCNNFINLLKCTECVGYDSLYDAAEDLQGDESIGHDFWLTRNGHGAGFWDGDYGIYGDLLTEVCKNFGECNLFAQDGEVGIS